MRTLRLQRRVWEYTTANEFNEKMIWPIAEDNAEIVGVHVRDLDPDRSGGHRVEVLFIFTVPD